MWETFSVSTSRLRQSGHLLLKKPTRHTQTSKISLDLSSGLFQTLSLHTKDVETFIKLSRTKRECVCVCFSTWDGSVGRPWQSRLSNGGSLSRWTCCPWRRPTPGRRPETPEPVTRLRPGRWAGPPAAGWGWGHRASHAAEHRASAAPTGRCVSVLQGGGWEFIVFISWQKKEENTRLNACQKCLLNSHFNFTSGPAAGLR